MSKAKRSAKENALVTQYRGMVVNMARKIVLRWEDALSLDELVAIGLVSLLNCARCKSFDPKKFSFGTYSGRAVFRDMNKASKKAADDAARRVTATFEEAHGDDACDMLVPSERIDDQKRIARAVRNIKSSAGPDAFKLLWSTLVNGRDIANVAKGVGMCVCKAEALIEKTLHDMRTRPQDFIGHSALDR